MAAVTELDPKDWDPRDPAFRHDPFPWYQALRERAPVHVHPEVGVVLSRHADVDTLLRDDRFGVATPGAWREAFAALAPPSVRMLSENMLLFVDPPQHTRIRSLVSQAFTPRRVEALRPRLTNMIDSMLDGLADESGFDVVHEIAEPFPIMAITELLDVPDTDRDLLRDWTVGLTAFDDIPIDIDALPEAARAADAFLEYTGELIAHRRAQPGDDLISALIAAEDGGEHLSPDELQAMIVLLLTYMGPLQVASGGGRWPLERVELHGHRIDPGTMVRVLLGSANRDPEVFEDPDRFDLHRNHSRHVAFGKGLHFCVGAALGRLEGQVVIPAVLRRFPALRLVDARPSWRSSFVTRQLTTLPVTTTG